MSIADITFLDSGWKQDPIKDLETGLGKKLNKAAMIVKTDAKLYAPWKTGTLRRGIMHAVHEKEYWAEVYSDVPYAVHQEYLYTPHMRPALDQNVERIRQIFKGK